MEIGDALKRFRNDFKLSQRQVTERIGVAAPQQWQKYEYKQMVPSAELLKKIAVEFGVSADYLLGLTDEPRPKKYDDEEVEQALALRAIFRAEIQKAVVACGCVQDNEQSR